MRSKTSFFHKGLAGNLLKRCWPVWLGYLVLMLLIFPISVNNSISAWRAPMAELPNYLASQILSSACNTVGIALFACMVVVMAVFSYLYNSRTCGMINAFPLKRESVFCTVYLTGLLPLLLADCLAAGVGFILFGDKAPSGAIAQWLSMVLMGNVAFYGFSVFCAMLTGSLFILPLVYAVLNFTAVVVESCMQALLKIFLFGYSGTAEKFAFLSPGYTVLFRLYTTYLEEGMPEGQGRYLVENYSVLIAYCAAGLLLSAFALLLYRKRRMETAGDTVAIPVLKPVFKYCMAVGTAIVLSAFITSEFFGYSLRIPVLTVMAGILLLAGALIGYYAAEMLIQKTMHVFRGKWKGLLITCAVLAVLAVCCEKDVLGYETNIPAPADVNSVCLSMFGNESRFTLPENIEDIIALQEEVLSRKADHERATDKAEMYFIYELKNGRKLTRTYRLNRDLETNGGEQSEFWQAQDLMNRPEGILSRHRREVEILPENIDRATINTLFYDESLGYEMSTEWLLTPSQAYDLYVNAVLPDMEAGQAGRYYFYESANTQRSDTTFYLNLSDADKSAFNSYAANPARHWDYDNVEIYLDSERTIAWLKENLDYDVKPYVPRDPLGKVPTVIG
ncbi:MAG: hypothetical protein IJG40_16270 [Oscillospiraceae bacterium]|nr:hypothetical protein [Oscillospiraceae bacterium]